MIYCMYIQDLILIIHFQVWSWSKILVCSAAGKSWGRKGWAYHIQSAKQKQDSGCNTFCYADSLYSMTPIHSWFHLTKGFYHFTCYYSIVFMNTFHCLCILLFSHTQHYFCNIETVAFFDKATQPLGGWKREYVSTWTPFWLNAGSTIGSARSRHIWDCRCFFVLVFMLLMCCVIRIFNITQAACHVGNVNRTQKWFILLCSLYHYVTVRKRNPSHPLVKVIRKKWGTVWVSAGKAVHACTIHCMCTYKTMTLGQKCVPWCTTSLLYHQHMLLTFAYTPHLS